MQNNIIWEGINDETLENCNVLTNNGGYEATSTVSMVEEYYVCNIEYELKTNEHWESQHCKITNCHEEGHKTLELQRLSGDKWVINGKEDPNFEGFNGIDISITPFTNTLIINRRQLREKESIQMKIIYIEPLKMVCSPIEVIYTKLSDKQFEYQNLTTGYNVVLDVDDEGFVTCYPGYFRMLS